MTPRSRHATSRRSRWQGYAARHGWRAVAVVVFEVGAERRAFVVAIDGCAVRSTATWEA